MRLRHMSLVMEKNYVQWVRRFLAFFPGRHPRVFKQGIKNAVYIATPMLRVDISLSLPYSLVKGRFKRRTVTDT